MQKTDTKHIGCKDDVMVRSTNELVNSRFAFTEFELDILFYLLFLVRDNVREYSFSLSSLTSLKGMKLYGREMKRYASSLLGKQSVTEANDEQWKIFNLFESVTYNKGIVNILICGTALPLFRRTKTEFTTMQLKSALTLDGKYAKRLYWLLCQWKKKGDTSYHIDDLRQLLGLDTVGEDGKVRRGAYPMAANFAALVKMACEEISSRSDIVVDATWSRTGKSFSTVSFRIAAHSVGYDAAFTEDPEKVEAFNLYMHYHMTEDQCQTLWKNGCNAKVFAGILKKVNLYFSKHFAEVENPTAYIVACLENEGYLSAARKMTRKELRERKARQQEYIERRQTVLTIKTAISNGAPIDCFKDLIKKFDIRKNEIYNKNK